MIEVDAQDLETRQAIQDCRACQEACLQAELKALQQNGTGHEFILLLQATADACSMTADSLDRGSDLSGQTAAVSAEVCQRFLENSELRSNDPVMTSCARKCRRCLQTCRRVCGSAIARGLLLGLAVPVFDSLARFAAA